MENYGKSIQNLLQIRSKSSPYFNAGEDWAEKFFIPRVVVDGLTADEVEALERYLMILLTHSVCY